MPADPHKLLAEALELSDRARAELAAELLESLDDEEDENLSLEEWQTAWGDEIDRRLRDVREGRATPVPAEEVFRAARARLKTR